MTPALLEHRPRTLLDTFFRSPAARPLRFAGTGLAAAGLQMILLLALVHRGWHPIPANLVAFLLAAQLNFTLSRTLTWHDRRFPSSLFRHWLSFHAAISAMALLNMLVFVGAHTLIPTPGASALGIAVGAFGNYLAGDRIVFSHTFPDVPPPPRRRFVA